MPTVVVVVVDSEYSLLESAVLTVPQVMAVLVVVLAVGFPHSPLAPEPLAFDLLEKKFGIRIPARINADYLGDSLLKD